MPSVVQLEQTLISAEYYFATLMDKVVDESLQLEPVNEAFVSRVDNLFYTIEALSFLVSRNIDTSDSTCLSVYNDLMYQLGVNTTLPDLSVDSSLILLNPIKSALQLDFVPYVGANKNVELGENRIGVGAVDFSTTGFNTTTSEGQMAWNDADGTLDLRMKGGNVTLQLGQEQLARVANKSGVDLLESNYQVVRVRKVGEGGSYNQRIAVVLAEANNELNATGVLGIVTETILDGELGFITLQGEVHDINTTGSIQGETWQDGDVLYLSPTIPGALTKLQPTAPQTSISMGYVVNAHPTQGKIFVKVGNTASLSELNDVSVNTPSTYDVLMYDSISSLWVTRRAPQVVTEAFRLSMSTYPGLLVYQTNGTEGLYLYKSSGWVFVI